MKDRPDGAELLAEARRLLREELMPELSGELRFKAAMIGNAMGMAERELAIDVDDWRAVEKEMRTLLGIPAETSVSETTEAFAARLRNGEFDGGEEAYKLLLNHARRRTAISNPRASD